MTNLRIDRWTQPIVTKTGRIGYKKLRYVFGKSKSMILPMDITCDPQICFVILREALGGLG